MFAKRGLANISSNVLYVAYAAYPSVGWCKHQVLFIPYPYFPITPWYVFSLLLINLLSQLYPLYQYTCMRQ